MIIGSYFDYEGLVSRAVRAYSRRFGTDAIQPANTSQVMDHGGKNYVVLRNCNGILALYQITASDRLRYVDEVPEGALERWGM